MPRDSSPDSAPKLRRAAGLFALLAAILGVLLAGKPSFTNASRPPRGVSDPGVALQVARSLQDVDDILSDAPSPDREVMRFKQRLDFAFIAAYLGVFVCLALLLLRVPGWGRLAGIAALISGAAAAVFDVMENLAILNLIELPLNATTAAAINAVRSASAAKWALAAFTLAVLSTLFWRRPGFVSHLIGGLLVLAAALIAYGFYDARALVWQAMPAGAGLVMVALVGLVRVRWFRGVLE